MIKYIVMVFIVVSLMGCSIKKDHTHFFCITPFGVNQMDSDDTNLSISPLYLNVKDNNRLVRIYRNMCVEIHD